MKCPNCNTIVEDEYNFCPNCRHKLERTSQQEEQQKVLSESTNSPIAITKNKVIWKINTGEIARHIKESEFAVFDNMTGMIIEDGVTAIIHIDGKEVAQINGGIYDFISNADIEAVLNERIKGYGLIEKIGSTWHWLVGAICGKKVGETINSKDNNQFKTMDDVIRHLNSQAKISVYLKIDRCFPSLYGSETASNGETSFVPMTIQTKYLDAQVGVSMLLQITDFKEFIRRYLCDKTSVTVSDIQHELNIYVQNILQAELSNEEINEYGIAEPAKQRIILRLKEDLQNVLHGIKVVRIVDITCNNEDFERFRAISAELYCSEKELDFVIRTNEFKNRLASVENEQKINAAKNDFELKKVLDEIDTDKILHEDELNQFYILLSRQKRIREAKDSIEEEKALSDIMRTGLLNKDEFDAFKQELDLKQFDRENIAEAMRRQSLAVLAKKNLDIETELLLHHISQEAEIEAAQFEAEKRQSARDSEALDIEEALYGKIYLSQKRRLQNELELEDITRRHRRSAEIEDVDVDNKLVGKKIEGQRIVDNYADEREISEMQKAQQRAQMEQKLAQQQEADRWEALKKKQEMSLSALERMEQMKKAKEEAAHARKMEEVHSLMSHEENMKEKEHAEKMAEIANQKLSLENEKEYTAEQLFAKRVAEGGGGAAAAVYAESFSSKKELEAERRAQEAIEKKNQEKDQLYDKMMDKQEQMMNKMMGFSERSMQVNASLVSGEAIKRDEKEKEQFDRLERMASQRIADTNMQKEEYREQMKHEQQRFDENQERSLNYTTRITEADLRAAKAKPQETAFCVEGFGNIPFTLEQVAAFITAGTINKRTVITANGTKRYAEDFPELNVLFDKCDFAMCPSCKEKVKKAQFCAKCGSEL